MSTVTALACDRCERVTAGGKPTALSIQTKRVLAREEGWKRFRLRSNGTCIDLCADCAPRARFELQGFEVDEYGAKR